MALWPRRGLPHDGERGLRKVDVGVGALVMQRAWDQLLVQGQSGLDQTDHARCGNQVSQVAFDRSNLAELTILCVAGPSLCQRGHFNGVAQGCACAVGFNIVDAAGTDAGVVQCHADGLRLPCDAGRGEAGFFAAVVVDAHALDDAINGVASSLCITEALEHHHAAAAGKQRARGFLVKRTAMPIG